MENEKRLDHALHNQAAAKLLHKDGNFSDWTITTSFYSAIHFCRYKLFPVICKSTDDIVDFDDYLNLHGKNNSNPHRELTELVRKRLKDIYYDYKELKTDCWRARYYNYKMKPKVADNAIEILDKIAKRCSNKKSPITVDKDLDF